MNIFTDIVSQVTTLVRKESHLARAELSENISRAALGLGLIVGGAVLLIPALVVLLQAGVAAHVIDRHPDRARETHRRCGPPQDRGRS